MVKHIFYVSFIVVAFFSILLFSSPIRSQQDYQQLSKESRDKLYFESCYTQKGLSAIIACYEMKEQIRGGNKIQVAIQEIVILFPKFSLILFIILGVYLIFVLSF